MGSNGAAKTIVITGASAGIGAAFARLAGTEGHRLVLVARRQRELEEVARASSTDALPVVADVTRRREVEGVLERALEHFTHVDVWINNAGRGITRPVAELSDADFDEMMRTNVKSALYGMQVVLPHFTTRGRGHIINISSMLGRVPFATQRSAYCAAKHAMNALTACLRIDLSRTHPGIKVSTLSPGVVATEFGVNALGGGVDSRQLPGAQAVDDVAQALLDLVREPQADAYTRPGMREMVVRYYSAEDMAEVEATFLPQGVPAGAPRR